MYFSTDATLEQVGIKYEITGNRVRQIVFNVIRKLDRGGKVDPNLSFEIQPETVFAVEAGTTRNKKVIQEGMRRAIRSYV